MRKVLGFIATAACFAIVAASPASSAELTLIGDNLTISLATLPEFNIPGGTASVFVSSGGGSFTEPAGIFSGFVALPRELFTGISLVRSLRITVANPTLGITASGGPGGGVGGHGGLTGSMVWDPGGLIALGIPLSPIGAGGTSAGGAATLMLTVTGHLWTTGAATVTGLASPTTSGFANTVTIAGFDNRTADHRGSLLLVSPARWSTNAIGNVSIFARQALTFVPEPGTLLLMCIAAIGTALVGRNMQD